MEEVIVQINNRRAFSILENLEALDVIKMVRRIPATPSEKSAKAGRAARLSEIQAVTAGIRIDLSNFRFNRDEANDYDS